ncbi:MAG TPA: sigma 54-interacting transcriptional regulator [Terriglobales bacterium]|nr:sigma 54-interacting transcriptional regulator [Terriglobales bacterium]
MLDTTWPKSGSEEIVGESTALNQALASVQQLAPSDAAVLIAGERGSGKELFARVIHHLSPRRNKSFVKVNCVTSCELLERELFGFEKEAFDGAISGQAGGLERADKGTLFLDELARFPLDLQPKLVRVLKRGEFEWSGGTHIVRVDVRFIAATRHDAAKWIAENRLRQDLYDQFNRSSIIQIPPLRERREDIPLLAQYFVQKFARRMNKNIEAIAPETMFALLNYDWPGNVTQLENFIQRAVILTEGSKLQAPFDEL